MDLFPALMFFETENICIHIKQSETVSRYPVSNIGFGDVWVFAIRYNGLHRVHKVAVVNHGSDTKGADFVFINKHRLRYHYL